jgi:hypothetical protein
MKPLPSSSLPLVRGPEGGAYVASASLMNEAPELTVTYQRDGDVLVWALHKGTLAAKRTIEATADRIMTTPCWDRWNAHAPLGGGVRGVYAAVLRRESICSSAVDTLHERQ